jgi:peroxiredoxin
LPSVNKIYNEFKSQGLEVLLVDIREDPETVKRTVRERGYVTPILLDQSGDVAGRQYGVWGTPTVYLIDRRGQLVGRIVGPRSWDKPEARKFVQDLLDAEGKR